MGFLTRTTRKIIGGSGSPPVRKIKPPIPFHRYVNRAYKAAKDADELGPTGLGLRASIPISIYLRSKGPDHVYGGVFDEIGGVGHHLDREEYFSGSLPKVAAMFAAFKLRAEARKLVAEVRDGKIAITGGTDTAKMNNFVTRLEAKLNLGDAVPRISTATGFNKKPRFPEILNVTADFSDPLAVNFTNDFRSHMRKMIIPSDNCSAGECIFRLSYPYINVVLMQDGYFNRDTMKGIWLCGDYIFKGCFNEAKKQAYVRIDTVNDCHQVTGDCGSAQNTTSKEMSRLFFNILLEKAVDPESSREMRAILHEGQHGSPPGTPPPLWEEPPDDSFFTRSTGVTVDLFFDIDGVKIGQGPLKPDPDRAPEVRSEGLLIKFQNLTPGEEDFDEDLKKQFDKLNLTGEAAVCYQNLGNDQPRDGVINVIQNSVFDYLNQVPVGP